jgi:hypothetical protein
VCVCVGGCVKTEKNLSISLLPALSTCCSMRNERENNNYILYINNPTEYCWICSHQLSVTYVLGLRS